MLLVYATGPDLQTWTGATAPSNADQLLRSASILVRQATKTARYDTDSAGLPTDATVAEAFKDATCAHAAAMAAAKVNPAAGGTLQAGVAASKKVGSAAVDYADAGAATAAKRALLTSLCPDAQAILEQAGLVPATVYTTG